jgi:tetratricopeptide (TPR) repeat protein
MDAVTYPEKKVIDFISSNLIPLLIAFDAQPQAADFNIKWTPTLITLGMDGREHHRTVGFLEPEDFVTNQILGIGKYHFDNDRFPEALTHFEKTMDEFPTSGTMPEAIFLQGVARYKNSGDPKPLKKAYEKLTADFPDNEWTKRAYPYRLL